MHKFENQPFRMLLRQVADVLRPVSDDLAVREAESIIQSTCHCSRSSLYLVDRTCQPHEYRLIQEIVEKRLQGMPLAYVLGRCYFHSREFKVSPAVLIPRPDTEILVETILFAESNNDLKFIDLGSGSGCVGSVLCMHRPAWRGVAIDIAWPACRMSSLNSSDHPIAVLCADRFNALNPEAKFDLIVSNPPYISEDEYLQLDASVRSWEPEHALKGGFDGLDFFRYICEAAPKYLTRGGRIYCEFGSTQSDALQSIFCTAQWDEIRISPDLAGRPRVFSASLRS